ncbi:probable glutathione S-transferase parA [Macadamia integrifolia]|uniref:probable glutathione S-transferase parA n=1 Tax=Macadamia integrifolia TaxID=60698 RepID=UPI001C532A0D|nr:probable glutathione S-transferase parA [Macadamia integrifolia]
MADEFVLMHFFPSPFGMRVKVALAEKGIEYEHKDQNPFDKSPLLLEMNPVHKKIPVLIHNGKPICESLIIVQYIDEVFKDRSPLLPSDPYQRAHARFWADFIDKKVHPTGRRLWAGKGEDQESGKKELLEGLKLMEEELGGKPYFNGESFGFVDLSFVPFNSWFYTYENVGKFSMEVEFPKLVAWGKRCMEKESVSKSLADPQMVYDFAMGHRKNLGLE